MVFMSEVLIKISVQRGAGKRNSIPPHQYICMFCDPPVSVSSVAASTGTS